MTPSTAMRPKQRLEASEEEAISVLNLHVGAWWCLVTYGQIYPGEVKAIDNGNAKVSSMHRTGGSYRWADPVDTVS